MLMAIFKRLAPELKGSITVDKGSEFARHGLLAPLAIWRYRHNHLVLRRPPSPPGASWQKGSVENTNGRQRRQLPRHLDLDTVSQADLQEIVLSLNRTPRKCIGYLTPIQAFFKGLGKDIQIRFA
jgi:IS30 family transposase